MAKHIGKRDIGKRVERGKNISPPVTTEESPEQQYPIFSLRYMSKDFCILDCTKEEKAAFADTLYKLSQMTWSQINSSARHGSGYERIAQTSIKASIPRHITPDVNLIAFRFCAKAPMVGYRERATFFVIWLDRNFSLYEH
ncbi:MAG: hypothetical protein EAZ09_07545 [Oscillatoriales cyanobacterium]|nr:MAG: hypothetical protein EAZ18_07165 [Oscillatoriales cyanobacterium]TAH23352.1 MAG: hypothetical protein EAZ09_07545 [Oscillatoriales cyanobacterium]